MPKESPTSARWRVLDEHVYETFKIFRIRRSGRINPRTGKRFDFFLMDGLDWVNIIPLTKDNKVVLVRQYRHGSESYTWEIPGGCVEAGEDPRFSACRELKEETGYEVKGEIKLLGTIHPNPAMQAMRCHCYVAEGVELTSAQALDPGEDIEVALKPIEEVRAMIGRGEITHAIVLAAFALFR
jgi:ADP-ribose pyrophosphatase